MVKVMLAPAAGSSKTLRAVALAATLSVGACTGVEFPPPPEALRAKATPLAVVAIAPPVGEPIPPDITDAGDAAAYGAGQGAVGSVIVGAGSGGPWGLILGILLTPVAAITGGAIGAAKVRSAETIAEAQKSIANSVVRHDVAALLRTAIVVRISALGLAVIDDEAAAPGNAESGGHLSITVESLVFQSSGRLDPDVELSASVAARLAAKNHTPHWYERTWRYRGNSHNYFALAAEDGRLAAEEVQQAIERFAEKIVADLLRSNEAEEYRDAVSAGAGAVRTVLVVGNDYRIAGPEIAKQE